MTDINKLINGFVESLGEEDLEYLQFKIEQKLDTAEYVSYYPEYEILCSCGHCSCPACKVFDLETQTI